MRSYYHRLAFAHHSYSIQMRPLRRFKQVIWGDIWHFPGAGAWNASLMCSFILYTHYHVQPLVNSRRLTAICIQCIDIVNTTIGCIMRMMIRRTQGTIFVYPRPKPSTSDNAFFPLSRDEKVYLVESGTWVETINLKLADCANNNFFSFFFATSDIHGIRVGQSICWVKRTANVGEIRQSKQVIEGETGSGDLVVILLGLAPFLIYSALEELMRLSF